MTAQELAHLSIAEAARLIRARQVSPVELVQASLKRIDDLDGKLNSFITVCHDQALAAARRAEGEMAKGRYRGPMHGIPYAVKNIYATKGIRTTCGSRVLKDWVPEHDCTAVRRLRSAGGILIGKNHCVEFAFGDHHNAYGPVHNPWNLDRTPGGSSSGSGASVAAGMVFGSMGSCTGGSIRGPASHCGIVGLKPTYGLVSRHGVFPLSWSLDHTGPMTRTVEDCALMLQATAGYDAKDPSSARVRLPDYGAALKDSIKGIRVGVPRELNEGAEQEVSGLVQRAIGVLRELGASVEEVSALTVGEAASAARNIISWSEAAHVHTPRLQALDEYSATARQKVHLGLLTSSTQYHKAQSIRRLMREEFARILERVDVLVGPVMRTPPGPLQPGAAALEDTGLFKTVTERSFTGPYNLTGMPAISVPCGFSSDGLPVGLQVAGRWFEDTTVLRVAHAYERATQWHDMHPTI